MALADLLERLERRTDTPDTPSNPRGVSAKPAPILACTLDTPDTPEIINAGSDALRQTRKGGCATWPLVTRAAVTTRVTRVSHVTEKAIVDANLAGKVQATAEILVSKDAVSKEVSKDTRIAERDLVDANALLYANVVLGERKDVAGELVPSPSGLWHFVKHTDVSEPHCDTCENSRKPGASRHCCARPDLPPAYGEGHPLRHLPDDGGADCGRWASVRNQQNV